MNNFWKSVVATILGIIILSAVVCFLTITSIIGSLASSGSSTTTIDDNSVLVLTLNGTIGERSEVNPLDKILNNGDICYGLDEILEAINNAKANDNVVGIFLQMGTFSTDSWATDQAIHDALAEFKQAGKWVVSYADNYTQSAYYIASVGNKVFLNPEGMVEWSGIGSQPMFLKNFLAKFGVKIQLAKVGTYKSAPERFMSDKMSDANRQQVSDYINSIWGEILADVAESRHISVDSLNAYADGIMALDEPQSYVARKFVDKLLYVDEVKYEIKKLLKIDDDDDINQITIADINSLENDEKGDEIAVYYAYGDIVQNNDTYSMSTGSHQIVAEEVCEDLDDLADDDDVKAVVIRINSGGGSAYASEQIWRAIENLKKEKPVVVSMGGMAASGGYYMSCNSDWIVAEPTSITGSIGIFGMFPDISELMTQKLGITFDEVKTNKNSTFGNLMARPFNDEEMNKIEKYVQRGYETFIKRVGDGRKMTRNQVDSIAQGHVYTAIRAKDLGLVDELGNLNAAVKKAAKLAKVDEYYTSSYPTPKEWYEDLLGKVENSSILDGQLRATAGELYEPLMLLKTIKNQDVLQARIPFIINK